MDEEFERQLGATMKFIERTGTAVPEFVKQLVEVNKCFLGYQLFINLVLVNMFISYTKLAICCTGAQVVFVE